MQIYHDSIFLQQNYILKKYSFKSTSVSKIYLF